jgi:4-hydroxy-3-methylbut-2-enyl diphosphate reductase
MVIIRASVMGFCSGVRSAVQYMQQAIELGRRKNLPVYTIGALIHNEQFLEHLSSLGIRVIESPEDGNPGVAVIRAHGIEQSLQERFFEAGYTIIDGTCPRVIKSQRMVRGYTSKGWHVILAGDPEHGEVKAVAGAAQDAWLVHIVHVPEDVQQVSSGNPVLVLSQTTFSSSVFHNICSIVEQRWAETGTAAEIARTICPATQQRQRAVSDMCKEVEAMIIVGGKNSSNTKRLFDLSRDCGVPSWHISTADEIPPEIYTFERVGLTAGASTPAWTIENIEKKLIDGSR